MALNKNLQEIRRLLVNLGQDENNSQWMMMTDKGKQARLPMGDLREAICSLYSLMVRQGTKLEAVETFRSQCDAVASAASATQALCAISTYPHTGTRGQQRS
jgi:hypothetical protein